MPGLRRLGPNPEWAGGSGANSLNKGIAYAGGVTNRRAARKNTAFEVKIVGGEFQAYINQIVVINVLLSSALR